MKGIFELRTARDLFGKLEVDYESLRSAPTDSYVAYNFFVTAWHLLEWLYPADVLKRNQVRDENPVLQVCEHLAVGAKHFNPSNERLKSVEKTGRISFFPKNLFPRNFFPPGLFPDSLVLKLSGEAKDIFGSQIGVLAFAEKVMMFWKEYEDLHQTDIQ